MLSNVCTELGRNCTTQLGLCAELRFTPFHILRMNYNLTGTLDANWTQWLYKLLAYYNYVTCFQPFLSLPLNLEAEPDLWILVIRGWKIYLNFREKHCELSGPANFWFDAKNCISYFIYMKKYPKFSQTRIINNLKCILSFEQQRGLFFVAVC